MLVVCVVKSLVPHLARKTSDEALLPVLGGHTALFCATQHSLVVGITRCNNVLALVVFRDLFLTIEQPDEPVHEEHSNC